MDDFETINLDNKQCKICNQETGEELIPCILRENFSSGLNDSPTSPRLPETSFVHRVCLERWDAIMKRTFFPETKKTWKDRVKGLISTRSTNNNETETWTPIDSTLHVDGDRSISKPTKRESVRSTRTSEHSVFSESRQAYRVENVGKRYSEHGEWRRSKVRICSVDSEDTEDKPHPFPSIETVSRHTRAKLQGCDLIQLTEFAEDLKLHINEVSSDLITHLQERDDLLLQKQTMIVTAGQLVDLQSNIKTASIRNPSRTAANTRNYQDTLPCK